MKRRSLLAGAAALPVASLLRPRRSRAAAAISDGVVKIGVLDDMSGVFADQQGMGDYIAARMAAEDFGGHVLGAPIEVVQADLQNKVDVGLAIARALDRRDSRSMRSSAWAIPRSRWRCRTCASSAQRIDVVIAAGTTDLTGKACSPYGVHWTYDNYSAAKGPATALVQAGPEEVVLHHLRLRVRPFAGGQLRPRSCKGLGATVLGHSLAPLGETDYSAHLLAATASGAHAVGHRRGRRRLHQHRQADGRVRADQPRHRAGGAELLADQHPFAGPAVGAGADLQPAVLLGP